MTDFDVKQYFVKHSARRKKLVPVTLCLICHKNCDTRLKGELPLNWVKQKKNGQNMKRSSK